MLRPFFLFTLWLASPRAVLSQSANICSTNATIAAHVLSVLNLTAPALAPVAAAAARGDHGAACEALADYYMTSGTAPWFRPASTPTPSSRVVGGATDEMVFHDIFTLAGVTCSAKIPRNADGGLRWIYRGPRNDYEFENCLNRHDAFKDLLAAWLATGNPLYGSYFNALVVDWALHNPCPGALTASAAPPCVPQNVTGTPCAWGLADVPGTQRCVTGFMESPWRSLEMGIRMGGAWPISFFGFQQALEFTTSGRVLMLLAIGEHFQSLAVDKTDSGMANWATTQWQGLVTVTVAFPELAHADELRTLALLKLEEQLVLSVYPDGVETEQSSSYDMATAADYFGTLTMLARAGAPPPPMNFSSGVEAMFAYGALSADPSGCLPRNGDSDVCGRGYTDAVALFFHRPDWTYAATNGLRGSPPDDTTGPSRVWPWSGQVVLRSGWAGNATWAWFDLGSYGSSGHGDRDKLSLNLHARGSMLLVDSGRFAYVGTDLSGVLRHEYQKFARAHNTLTFDGCDQLPLPAVATQPLSPDTVRLSKGGDAAWGSMSAYDTACLKGTVTHTRGVWYERAATAEGEGDFLVVVDGVTSDRGRVVEAFWHAHPNGTITLDGDTLTATVGGATYAFVPTTAQACVVPAAAGASGAAVWSQASVIKGQVRNDTLSHVWQGWFSATYDHAYAAPVAVYSAHADAGRTAYAWLVVPTATRVSCATHTAEVVSVLRTAVVVAVTVAGGARVNITVPMTW